MKYEMLLLVSSQLHITHISVSRNRISFPVSSLGFRINLFSSQIIGGIYPLKRPFGKILVEKKLARLLKGALLLLP